MRVIRWICGLIQSMRAPILSPVRSAQAQPKHQRHRRLHYSIISGILMGGLAIPGVAWSGDLSGADQVEFHASVRPVVAAGFGFQNADSSTITVKTYDALTGEVLSNESYDLHVKEEGTTSSGQPRERIFAGGVGSGTDGLSDFTLRVYDAATGKFLWEGRLNLSVTDDGSGSTYRVVAHLQPQTSMRTIHHVERASGQPSFLLRAIDPVTGQLVWADQFLAGRGIVPRIERVSEAAADHWQGPMVGFKNFDFRIRMFDDHNRQMLWEDAIVPTDETGDLSLGRDSETEMLPGWANGRNSARKDVIRFDGLLRSVAEMMRTPLL